MITISSVSVTIRREQPEAIKKKKKRIRGMMRHEKTRCVQVNLISLESGIGSRSQYKATGRQAGILYGSEFATVSVLPAAGKVFQLLCSVVVGIVKLLSCPKYKIDCVEQQQQPATRPEFGAQKPFLINKL